MLKTLSPWGICRWLLFLILCMAPLPSLGLGGTPHIIYGRITGAGGGLPDASQLAVYSYVSSRPDEMQNVSVTGCGCQAFLDGVWLWFEAGNFATSWVVTDKVRVVVIDSQLGQTGCLDISLSDAGSEHVLDVTLASGDHVGPIASGTLADGSNPGAVQPQTSTVELTATVDDTHCGGSTIASAEYFVDTDPGLGSGLAMQAVDGSFDTVDEAVRATVNVSSWSVGESHKIYVRGKDTFGNWGTSHSVELTMGCMLYDFDCDGDVDVVDIMRVTARWNSFRGDSLYDAQYDLDSDGDIDVVDIMKVAAAWAP